MRKLIAMAACAVCLGAPASAATLQLASVNPTATGHSFVYSGTLAPTEGVMSGSRLVILDFAGYVDGSIFSPYSEITGTVEFTTSGIVLSPSVVDDPTLYNLVFTYDGADFRVDPAGSPYPPFDFSGLAAESIFGNISLGAFAGTTILNAGVTAGTTVFSSGTIGVPTAVPELGPWALMAVGLGAIGLAARRSRKAIVSYC